MLFMFADLPCGDDTTKHGHSSRESPGHGLVRKELKDADLDVETLQEQMRKLVVVRKMDVNDPELVAAFNSHSAADAILVRYLHATTCRNTKTVCQTMQSNSKSYKTILTMKTKSSIYQKGTIISLARRRPLASNHIFLSSTVLTNAMVASHKTTK